MSHANWFTRLGMAAVAMLLGGCAVTDGYYAGQGYGEFGYGYGSYGVYGPGIVYVTPVVPGPAYRHWPAPYYRGGHGPRPPRYAPPGGHRPPPPPANRPTPHRPDAGTRPPRRDQDRPGRPRQAQGSMQPRPTPPAMVPPGGSAQRPPMPAQSQQPRQRTPLRGHITHRPGARTSDER